MASNGVPQPHHTPYQADFLRDNSDRGLRVWALLDLQRQYRVSKQDLEDGKRQLEQQHYDQCHCLFQQRKYIIGGDARLVCRDSDGRTVWQFYHGPQRWLELIRGEEKRIPGFWLQPMKNNPEVAQWVSARDEQALKCLSNISVEPIRGDDAGPVAPAFRLVFEFDSNPFFRNSSLVKDFYYRHKSVDDNIHVGLACNDAPGCSIDWNTGMDLTMAPVNDPYNVYWGSFFDFFNDTDCDYGDDDSSLEGLCRCYTPDTDDTEDVDSEILPAYVCDFELGEAIRDRLIPNAIDWYTDEALLPEYVIEC